MQTDDLYQQEQIRDGVLNYIELHSGNLTSQVVTIDQAYISKSASSPCMCIIKCMECFNTYIIVTHAFPANHYKITRTNCL